MTPLFELSKEEASVLSGRLCRPAQRLPTPLTSKDGFRPGPSAHNRGFDIKASAASCESPVSYVHKRSAELRSERPKRGMNQSVRDSKNSGLSVGDEVTATISGGSTHPSWWRWHKALIELGLGVSPRAGHPAGWVNVAMPTIGWLRVLPPMEPKKVASPKVKMPPSEASIQ